MEAIREVMEVAVDLVKGHLSEQVQQGVEKLREQVDEQGDAGFPITGGFGLMNIGDAVATACLYTFIFGWEACNEYGKKER